MKYFGKSPVLRFSLFALMPTINGKLKFVKIYTNTAGNTISLSLSLYKARAVYSSLIFSHSCYSTPNYI